MITLKNLICSTKQTTRLYKQPSRIGDVIEVKSSLYLIIGIQDVQIAFSKLDIVYVCQKLDEEFLYQPSVDRGEQLTEFVQTIRTGKEDLLKRITLGRIFFDSEDRPYQTVEYLDVEIEYTDINISFLARPIRPVARKEAKARLLNERKRKLNLTLV